VDCTFILANADHIFVRSCYNLRVQGCTFNSLRDNGDHNDHIQLFTPWRDIVITGNHFKDECDQAIVVTGRVTSPSTYLGDNLTVTNNNFDNIAKVGTAMGGVYGATITGNTFDTGNDYVPGSEGHYNMLFACTDEGLGGGLPADSAMLQNRNMFISGNTFQSPAATYILRTNGDATTNGTFGNVITGNTPYNF
jgi:polygalacturonase